MVRYQFFPWVYFYQVEQEIINFILGDPDEQAELTEKVANDLNIKPARHLFSYRPDPARNHTEVAMEGLNSRRGLPMVYSSPEQARGYRVLYGIFDYDDSLPAGILLDENNQVVHRWVVDRDEMQKLLDQKNAEDGGSRHLISPNKELSQGLEVLPDGSIVLVEGKRGNGMHKISYCSELTWSALGSFHHSVTRNPDDGTLWSLNQGQTLVQVDAVTGEKLTVITIDEITRANPYISIFTPRRVIRTGVDLIDTWHENDVEALPLTLASAFPMFEAGDLLVSNRSTNLVYVIDPDDLKIKWWHSGTMRRQHDPDWMSDGMISVYDNNIRETAKAEHPYDGDVERFSNIVRIDPATNRSWIEYNGQNDNVYSIIRGSHQILPNGNTLITSPIQGRVIEINSQGETVFEFVNVYDENDALIITEAVWVPMNYFDFDPKGKSLCN